MNAVEILHASDYNLDRAFIEVLDNQQHHLSNGQVLNNLTLLVQHRIQYLETKKSRSKEVDFLAQEQYIWKLLGVVSRIQPSDPASFQCSQIKSFFESLPNPNASEEEDMVAEVEEEIRDLVRRNRLHYRTPKSSVEFESLNKRIFQCIRKGNTKEALSISLTEDNPWRTMLLERYLDNIDRLKAGDTLDWLPEQRTAWRKTYETVLSGAGMGQYEEALHGVITGETSHVLPVCWSWEDVIWTFYNARIQEAVDDQIYQSERRSTYLLSDEFVKISRTKDDSLSDPCVLFFHTVVSAILTGTVSSLFIQILSALRNESNEHAERPLWISINIREHVLRFTAALILYYRQYFNEPATAESNEIMRLYAESNGKADTLRPKVLALYASHLFKSTQIELVSAFLSNFEWDEEEQSILYDMGRQYGLDMTAIARCTAAKEIESYLEENKIASQRRIPRRIRFDDDISDSAKRCLRNFNWLLLDERLYFKAVSFANQLIRHAIETGRSQLAEAVLTHLPDSITNRCVLQLGGERSDELFELENYRLRFLPSV
ncbi:107-domain-containing protein [Fennellomyces sp. T-0311]|nr:107-domain-containing protein [Fennellomyces sp. T-0311]